jgi:glycosyltransferase involved in cell wall biosynthesis
MEIVYVANARMPTEKAHGIAIMKACQAFARAGATVSLVAARRRHAHAGEDVHAFYGIPERFRIVRLPTLDLNPLPGWFLLESLTFYASLFFWALFGSRKRVVYTREAPALLLALLGYRTFLESHVVSERRRTYFALARLARGVVTVASSLKRLFLDAGFAEESVLAEPNAVDLSVFDLAMEKSDARRALNLPEQAFLMVYTGNFTTRGMEKGLMDSLRALAKLPEAFELVAVGGSDADIATYRAHAEELGVASRTHLVGHRTQAELARYQKAADVLLMPFPDTPYYRTHMSPLKMFEYAAAKRPIIATDLPTIREVLGEETAIIVPPDSPEAIAKAAAALAAGPARGEAVASAAYERVARTRTWDARAAHLLGLINKEL